MTGTITFEDVGMCYRLHRERVRSLKEAVLGGFRHLREADELWALRGVSFEVRPGEAVGLVGANGSGKSTLLKLAAGVLRPTEGRVRVEGRVAPIIELAAGFDPELSGRDNVFLNGALMGRARRDMARRLERIFAFAELEGFEDVPVKNYSSGMYARLGFAIAVDVEPEILVVDEVLAVGDERFQARCLERIRALLAGGTTLFLVSHQMDQVAEVCRRVLLLHRGGVCHDGAPADAIRRYRELQGFTPPPVARTG
ncbi:ABC transporter-related protein [Anaeromyxobacter sp. K]|uniref:ABC transporter related n=1 Tax=Anaeromyxobacter dehalogenans (strain ATCC BAA-258 / DSM 21875 / 2CP-1) TaxID=455488 RepID=B8J4Y3_ANAD2|nr:MULTISPECIES: ABC transporter ATP-binding protein [Anaeromyxobacter]ACG72629.1 ABC transporter-related protein [Anaeromyxobacter sp. K]ACL64838.1 ABC transporter related [Anaeromyxobacter dehalogenans 2CP-1]